MSIVNRVCKRKRFVSEVDNVENSPGQEQENKMEQRRKRARDSPPQTPTPLSPHNQCDTPESSPKAFKSKDMQAMHGILPTLTWLNRSGMMDVLVEHDSQANISPTYFERHPNLSPQMRAVLLDWLSEVCVAYKLHRESYYLAINYFDRYLSITSNIPKTQLQLIGVTCLFIAVKVEEIYPPKVSEFAYVTSDACSSDDILKQELLILNKLEWSLGAMTINGWLSLLLQLWHNRSASPRTLMFPNHPVKDFLLAAQLLDFAIIDDGSLQFSYQAMAAAAIHTMTDFKEVISSPPVEKEHRAILECVSWIKPFAEVLRERMSPRKLTNDATHNYTAQTHHFDLLEMLEDVQKRISALKYSSVILTPPPSSEKPQCL